MKNNRQYFLEKYFDYLKYQKNYSDYTILNYKNDILEYFHYLDKENLDFSDIIYSDIRFYLIYLKEEKKDNNASINRKLSALRSFYKYLVNEGIVKNNIFSLLSGPKRSRKLPRYFEYNELEELFLISDKKTPVGQRDLLLLEMLYATGVRVGELVHIKVCDINLSEKTINHIIGTVKNFHSYFSIHYDKPNKLENIKRLKVNKLLPKVLTIDEINKLLDIDCNNSFDCSILYMSFVESLLYTLYPNFSKSSTFLCSNSISLFTFF